MTTICHVCQKEITPEQKKGGYYAGGKAWLLGVGDYVAKPSHRQCNLAGLLRLAGATRVESLPKP